jgi:hypothetical protein
MTTPQSRDRRIVALLEDAICTQELTLTWRLTVGLDTSAEETAITKLYQRLRATRIFQAHQENRPSIWLLHFP